MRLGTRRGQHTLEYAVVLTVVAAAMTGIVAYVRRAAQANIKAMEEELSGEPRGDNLLPPAAPKLVTPEDPGNP